MRGDDQQQGHVFSYISPEQRVRKDHPLRPIRTMVDKVLKELSPEFNKMYSKVGRPSIPPEQLLRTLLLQMLYSVRSERLLVEEIDYNILFRWFVGLNLDDAVWDAGASPRAGMGLGRTLHGRWEFAGSLGQREEFSTQEQEEFVSAG
jgi:transposase